MGSGEEKKGLWREGKCREEEVKASLCEGEEGWSRRTWRTLKVSVFCHESGLRRRQRGGLRERGATQRLVEELLLCEIEEVEAIGLERRKHWSGFQFEEKEVLLAISFWKRSVVGIAWRRKRGGAPGGLRLECLAWKQSCSFGGEEKLQFDLA